MTNIFKLIIYALLLVVSGFLLFMLFLPIAALFFMWFWNQLCNYVDVIHVISYWESVKLCFYIYIVKALFSANISVSNSKKI